MGKGEMLESSIKGKGEMLETSFFTFSLCDQTHSHHLTVSELFTTLLMTLKKKPFENMVGKGENAHNQHYLLFPRCFLLIPHQTPNISATFISSSSKYFQFGIA